jgi:lipopolysaccharide assembly protein A
VAVLRTIFWVLLAVALVLFAINNWHPVEVRIWATLILETKLPALVIGAFLLGLVPMWALYRTMRWRMKRRIAALEAMIARPNTVAPGAIAAAPPPPPALPPEPAV